MDAASPLRDVSDTALWVAHYRAEESDRPDAAFRDPFARRLAGERGRQIAAHMGIDAFSWTLVARTHLIDRVVEEQAARGVDLVLNLAAGLDTRPYRLTLPAALRWVEADLPGMIEYKEGLLRGETPVCRLERVAVDLADAAARRALFETLARGAGKTLVITEGLLIYLEPALVSSLAEDLRDAGFSRWVLELSSPGILRRTRPIVGAKLDAARAPFKFGPAEGPGYFAPRGWNTLEVRSLIKAARKIGRLSPLMWLISWLPESSGKQGDTPWSGVCLFENARTR